MLLLLLATIAAQLDSVGRFVHASFDCGCAFEVAVVVLSEPTDVEADVDARYDVKLGTENSPNVDIDVDVVDVDADVDPCSAQCGGCG